MTSAKVIFARSQRRRLTKHGLCKNERVRTPVGGSGKILIWPRGSQRSPGAALLALKAENPPDGYAAEPDAAPYLERLREYLKREYSSQPVMNQLYVLWASAKSPELLTSARRKSLLAILQGLQQPGGWALSSMEQGNRPQDSRWRWIRKQLNIALKPRESDGCATGLVVLVLEELGTSRQDPMLMHGLQWLERHQDADGSWRAESLNEKRNPQTDVGRFMVFCWWGLSRRGWLLGHKGIGVLWCDDRATGGRGRLQEEVTHSPGKFGHPPIAGCQAPAFDAIASVVVRPVVADALRGKYTDNECSNRNRNSIQASGSGARQTAGSADGRVGACELRARFTFFRYPCIPA